MQRNRYDKRVYSKNVYTKGNKNKKNMERSMLIPTLPRIITMFGGNQDHRVLARVCRSKRTMAD